MEHHKNINFQMKTIMLPKKKKKKWVGWDPEPGTWSPSPGPRKWALGTRVPGFWCRWISLSPVTCLVETLNSLPNSCQPPRSGILIQFPEPRATSCGPAVSRFLSQSPKSAPCLTRRAILVPLCFPDPPSILNRLRCGASLSKPKCPCFRHRD